jgi:uncharacterized repeat protein (TIGR04052 family)
VVDLGSQDPSFNSNREILMDKRDLKRMAELGIAMTAVAALIAGCGGSSSSSSSSSGGSSGGTAILTGIVADGYLSGATACLDKNANAVCDAGEPSATTNASGVYSITGLASTDASTYNVIAEIPATAIDADTGSAVGQAFTLAAPVGASFVSPLTSLVQDKVAAGATVASAVAAVNQALGIPAASGVSALDNYVALKGAAADQTNGHFRAHEAAKTIAKVLQTGKAMVGSTAASTDQATMKALLAESEMILLTQAASNAAAAGSLFSPATVNASSVTGAGSIKLAIAANKANATTATQPVTINFDVINGAANVGTTGCTTPLTLGSANTQGTLQDLRFYVSNVALIDASGNYAPVVMTANANQAANVALLDFEQGNGTCGGVVGGMSGGGNAATYTGITGNVAPGSYVGIAFTVGVPGNLNHTNVADTAQPALLQSTAMNWSWQGGRKFVKWEFAPTFTAVSGVTVDTAAYAVGATSITLAAVGTGPITVGDTISIAGDFVAGTTKLNSYAVTAGAASASGATITIAAPGLKNAITAGASPVVTTAQGRATSVHIGSTGCSANPALGQIVNGCSNPNRMSVKFASFNPSSQKISLDLGSLFAGVDLSTKKTWMGGKMLMPFMGGDPNYYFGKFQIDKNSGMPINDGAAQTLFVVQ